MRPEAQPKNPWDQQRKRQELAQAAKEFPWMDDKDLNAWVSDKEQRELAQPAAEQAKDVYNQAQADDIRDKFIKRAELLTQKKGPELFKDITGEMQNNFIRTVQKDIRENPHMTVEDAVNKRATQMLAITKAKRKVDTLAAEHGILDAINPYKKTELVKKLGDAAEIFSKVGDEEELNNILKTKSYPGQPATERTPAIPAKKGFGLSPSRAAWVSYKRSPQVQAFTDKIKKNLGGDYIKKAKYYASQLANTIQDSDSILSIYQEIKNRDPNFDDAAFFDELRSLKDQVGFTQKQREEFIEGNPNYFQTWGDRALFPINVRL